MKRVILDTNIFVSMALGGQVGKINDEWRTGKFILVVSEDIVVLADTSDNKFIEAAIKGGTDYIVSGDKHLLDLKEYKSIPIITAREFIDILEVE